MVNCGGKHDKGNDIPMKIWNKTHHLTDTNLILNETFTEDAFFFDIETTGFSPTYTFLYLIGCVIIMLMIFCDSSAKYNTK